MDFYERKRRAGIDLAAWVENNDRDLFSLFCRRMLLKYGFSRPSMERLLEAVYPEFEILDELLETRGGC